LCRARPPAGASSSGAHGRCRVLDSYSVRLAPDVLSDSRDNTRNHPLLNTLTLFLAQAPLAHARGSKRSVSEPRPLGSGCAIIYDALFRTRLPPQKARPEASHGISAVLSGLLRLVAVEKGTGDGTGAASSLPPMFPIASITTQSQAFRGHGLAAGRSSSPSTASRQRYALGAGHRRVSNGLAAKPALGAHVASRLADQSPRIGNLTKSGVYGHWVCDTVLLASIFR
jgi:hypothetical protein